MRRHYVEDHLKRRTWFGDLCTSESRVARGLRLVAALGSVDTWEAIQCAEHAGRPPSVAGRTSFSQHLRTEQHFDQITWENAARLMTLRGWDRARISSMRHRCVVVDAAPAFKIFHTYNVVTCTLAPARMLSVLDGDQLSACLGAVERWIDDVEKVRTMRYRRQHRNVTPQVHRRLVDLLVAANEAWMHWIGAEIRRRSGAGSP